MQLLISHTTSDPAAWRRWFSEDRENQGKAGLTMLQLWVETGNPNTMWALFEVSDRDDAQPWVDNLTAGMATKRAQVTDMAYHFLETA
ncbi:DUF3303 family protein [Oceaniglobus indicus]|uniref:DUF3303 family protein n=1 Tax=Oceaniglobus indicus TaxID=2047749 RepID=UPI000C18D97B|nr:DUF3303 family protein [Oceaniglobus indicus]